MGKSSLFNWLAGKRLAIVDDGAGVTRDRMTYFLSIRDRFCELVDTGGMGFQDPDNLTKNIDEQIECGIESADIILFVVDSRSGLCPLDQEVAKRLRYVTVPIVCVANKTDNDTLDSQADEFYRLGRGKLVRVSTQQNRGQDELLELIYERLPAETDANSTPPKEAIMKVAIVGRQNTGKSTFVNTLVKAPRVIVSEVPGTTRDSIDVRFEVDGKAFIAIDTPGMVRDKSITTDLDFYSVHRAQRSIRRADVVFLFFDPTQRITKVDKDLCGYIAEQYKPCVFVVNKCDLMADSMPTEKWVGYLRDTFRTMWHVPIAFVTGQSGKNLKALLNHGQMLYKQSLQREATGGLNRLLRSAIEHNPPPMAHNHRPKIFYATQVGVQPPTIVLFCSNPDELDHTYRRYLLGVFRDQLDFGEVPIKLYLRRRESADAAEEKAEAGK